MKNILFLCYVFMGWILQAQNFASGVVMNSENIPIRGAQVINMSTDQSVYTNDQGVFKIASKPGDELRIVTYRFERASVIIGNDSQNIKVILKDFVKEIPGVTILSERDVNRMKQNIGVPGPPEKPREKAPGTLKEIGAWKFALQSLNLFNLYKLISGDARRTRELYRYEDLQEELHKVADGLGSNFFVTYQIPQEKQIEFVHYWIGKTNGDPRLAPNTIEGEALLVLCAQDFSKSIKTQSS